MFFFLFFIEYLKYRKLNRLLKGSKPSFFINLILLILLLLNILKKPNLLTSLYISTKPLFKKKLDSLRKLYNTNRIQSFIIKEHFVDRKHPITQENLLIMLQPIIYTEKKYKDIKI